MSLDPQDSIGIPGQRCPACRTRNPPAATACFFCGHQLTPLIDPGSARPRMTGAPDRRRITQVPAPPRPLFDEAGNRICMWCNAANPADARRCAACGVAFPVPGAAAEADMNAAPLALQLQEPNIASEEREADARRDRGPRWAARGAMRLFRRLV